MIEKRKDFESKFYHITELETTICKWGVAEKPLNQLYRSLFCLFIPNGNLVLTRYWPLSEQWKSPILQQPQSLRVFWTNINKFHPPITQNKLVGFNAIIHDNNRIIGAGNGTRPMGNIRVSYFGDSKRGKCIYTLF